MRHQHAGLAIPDFPLAYGKLWPAMDADSVARYNQQRIEVVAANPITAFQIGLQMIHRLLARHDSWRGRLCRVVHPARARREELFEPDGPGLAGVDSGECCWGGNYLVEQGRGYGDRACAGRRAFVGARRNPEYSVILRTNVCPPGN